MTLLTKEAREGQKVNIKKFYNLPEKVIHCSKCVVSNQRPRITFDENNVCSACNFADKKNNKIDWNLREKGFKIFATNIEEKMDIGMWLFHAVEEKTVFMLLTC